MTRSFLVVVLALGLVAGAGAPAWAGAPTDQVREYTEAVIKVLEDPALKAEDKKPERRAAVRKIATEVFDVQETARRALGPHWQQRTPEQREEVPVEARLLRRTDRWLIYDILIENISLIGNYRAQFDRIIRTSSYEDLVKRLRSRGEFLKESERPRRTER